MQLFIMRHGEAQMQAGDDALRPLNDLGCIEVARMGEWLKRTHNPIDLILVSPYVRTQQSLKLLVSQLGYSPLVQTVDFITPLDDAEDVHHYIDGLLATEKHQRILLITHMPLVSYLVASLTINQSSPLFQTASIAEIDYNEVVMKGELIGLISPIDLV